MALEIKVLDYGDIELESSFLVLGRGCGQRKRTYTYGFLILGGPWPWWSIPLIATTRSWKASACVACSSTRT